MVVDVRSGAKEKVCNGSYENRKRQIKRGREGEGKERRARAPLKNKPRMPSVAIIDVAASRYPTGTSFDCLYAVKTRIELEQTSETKEAMRPVVALRTNFPMGPLACNMQRRHQDPNSEPCTSAYIRRHGTGGGDVGSGGGGARKEKSQFFCR